MKKILHVGIGSNLGGIETYILKISRSFKDLDYHFDFIVHTRDLFPGHEELLYNGSNFFYARPRNKGIFNNFRDIYRICREEKPDVIHCHFLSLSYITPVIVGQILNIPVIIHAHSSSSPKSIFTRSLHLIHKFFLSKNGVYSLAVSKLAANWMFESIEDCKVLNNGIETKKYQFSKQARNKIRDEFSIDKKTFVMIHIGTLAKVKNHKFLLDVFEQVVSINPDSKLFLVGGDGILREEIDEYISSKENITDKVIFTGIRKDVNDLLSASDVMVFPSFYEGFPGAVLEAQTSGLPCIISDTITNEVVVQNNCIRLSLDQTAETWAEFALDKELKIDRSEASNIIEEKGLSVEQETKELEKIYRELSSY